MMIALVANCMAPVGQAMPISFDALAEKFTTPKIGEKDGPGIMPAEIQPGPRTQDRVTAVHFLMLDVEARAEKDKMTGRKRIVGPEAPAVETMLAELALWGWQAALHTTHSHTPAHPRYRLVFALERPLAPTDLRALGLHVAALLGIGDCIDRACLEPTRLFYMPRVPIERLADYRYAKLGDIALPVDQLLADARKIEAAQKTIPQRSGRTGNVIDQFNEGSDVGAILEAHGYKAKGRKRWLWSGSTTGMPGVRQLDSGRVYSSHGGDPLNDGHAHDAFDLFRILAHGGDTTAAIKAAARLTGLDKPPREIREGSAAPAPAATTTALITCKPLDWNTLADTEPAPRKWFIDHWLASGPTLMVGQGGIGKTQLAQQMGTCLAGGLDFVDRVVRPLKLLFWGCEDAGDEFHRRQRPICDHYGVDMKSLAGKLIIMPRLGLDNCLYTTEFGKPMWTPLIGELQEQIADYQADVVLLDNIGQMFGANENDRHHVTSFVNGLVGACRGREVALVLMGHPARGNGSEFAGSGAWENAVRMRWFLGSSLPGTPAGGDDDRDDAVRFLCKRKANYSSKDFRQFTYADGVLKLDTPADAGMGDYHRRQLAKSIFLSALVKLKGMAVETTDANSSKSFAPTVILQYKLNQSMTKSDLANAMRDLMLEGRLCRAVVGKYSNRAERMGLVISE